MINQQIIKAENKKRIYQLISEKAGISRAELAAMTRLSKTTVSSLVDELVQQSYILDEGAVESKRQGRRPNSLVVNDKKDCVIVCCWKKRILQIALISTAFEVESAEEVALEESMQENPAKMIWVNIRNFQKTIGKERRVLGICIAIPGMIDWKQQRMISTVLPVIDDGEILKTLRKTIETDCPLAVFNDTACMAYAENAFGGVDIQNYIYLNVNEGVGASLIQNGRILRGATGMGTQFGHFSIDRNGAPCRCGNRGCLENRIGEMFLKDRALECGALQEFAGIDQILFKHVGERAQAGMPGARRMIQSLAEDMGFALGNLITVFHPDTIVIGGMGKKLGMLYLEAVQQCVHAVGFRQFVKDVTIRFTSLGENAIFIGAAKYYLDMHFDFLEEKNRGLFLY